LYEALEYGVGHFCGSVGTNIVSMCAAAFILWRFLALCRKLGIAHEYLLAGCVLFVPAYWIAASSTTDYMWSIAFLIAAAELLLDSRLAWASIAGAIAMGFRASNSLVLAGAYAGLLIYAWQSKWPGARILRILASGIAAAVLGALFFVPSWQMTNRTLQFLTPGIGPAAMWTLKMHVGRFFYKGIYLFGPIATVLLLFFIARDWKRLSPVNAENKKARFIFLGAFLGNIVLFAKFPVEVSYLLPGLVFFMLLAGMSFLNRKSSIVAVLCGIASFNVFSISLAKPNIPMHATNAKLTFTPRKGALVEDIEMRLKAKQCETATCWAKNVGEQSAL